MKISKEHLNKIITEEVQRALSEITDDELERLLAMGRKKQSPKEKITQVIGDNPEEATDAMFNILGADGIKDIMIALAHASGDEELLNYTKTMNEQEGVENKGDKSFTLKLPKFRISEEWGRPGSDDRKIIEMFTSKIKGGTLAEKISSLNSFVAECDAACASTKDVAEILANLVFLDSLATVVYDFNPMTGGFLFESLMAALLGGDAKQIDTKGGIDQDVTDIMDHNGRPMSLKFFFETGSQYIKASYNNLLASIERHKQPMIYLIGIKNREFETGKVLAIDFYEFSVGNGEDIPGDYSASDLGSDNGLPTSWIIGGKRRGRAPKGQENVPNVRMKKTNYYLGTLNFGNRDEMVQIAQNYVTRLGSVLVEIYQQIDALSNNVNEYFLGAPDAKGSALAAQQNALTLKADTEAL